MIVSCAPTLPKDNNPSIQVEVDFPSNHLKNSVPILDVRVWIEKVIDSNVYRIMHEFYMKDVSSKAVIDARSALSWDVKRTVLTQEVLRIMLNCSKELEWDKVATFLNDMMIRMQFSGYTSKFRHQVLNSVFKAYDKMIAQDASGDRPLYRPKDWNREERVEKKKDKRQNWYKKGGYDSAIFVPATPKSVLQKGYQKAVTESGLRIRIVERAGNSIKNYLQRSDPFKSNVCRKEDCFVCTTGGKGNCSATSVVYEVKCKECADVSK